MPVAAPFVALGSALGASAATAGLVGAATVVGGASIAMQGYGLVQSHKAAQQSAQLAKDVADYNARVDLAEAKQIEIDSDENTRRSRAEAAVYTSRQRAAYAASGVLAGGSALDVEVETVGRMEQEILQNRVNAGRESSKREAAARMGVLYGQAQSDAIKRQDTVNMLNGGVGILSTASNLALMGVGSMKGKG